MNRILIAVGAFALWTGLAFAAGWTWRADRADLTAAKRDKADATAVVEAVQGARETEHKAADRMADIGAKHEEDRRDAASVPDAVAADLRAGVVRLQEHWAGCETSRLAEAASATVQLDEASRLRSEAAGRIVQIGRDADDQVRSLQDVVEAYRSRE